MKTFAIIFTFLFFSYSHYAYAETPSQSDAKYIPKDLEDCFIQINEILPNKIRKSVFKKTEDEFSVDLHMTFGIWMRNNWGLWRGSRLSEYFNELGIYHPDDMSGIIIDSYYRKMNNQEIKLDEQIKLYQNYWKAVKTPSKDIFPQGIDLLEFNSGMYYDRKDTETGFIHIGTIPDSDDIWIYDINYGWAKITANDLELLEKNQNKREKLMNQIFNF